MKAVMVDPVGGDASAAALRAMAWRGRLVIVGFAAGTVPVIKANYLLVKNIEVSGLQWSDDRDWVPAQVAQVQSFIFELYRRGKLSHTSAAPCRWRSSRRHSPICVMRGRMARSSSRQGENRRGTRGPDKG